MTRTLAFAGTASTQGALLPIDPWSATAAQLAAVIADVREDATADGEPDAAILAHLRATLRADDVYGALDPDGSLARAYVAVLTPRASA
jgi:hypothetical protein